MDSAGCACVCAHTCSHACICVCVCAGIIIKEVVNLKRHEGQKREVEGERSRGRNYVNTILKDENC